MFPKRYTWAHLSGIFELVRFLSNMYVHIHIAISLSISCTPWRTSITLESSASYTVRRGALSSLSFRAGRAGLCSVRIEISFCAHVGSKQFCYRGRISRSDEA